MLTDWRLLFEQERARADVAEALLEAEDQIVDELNAAQGAPADVGYYAPDPALARAAMRPSATFNSILESL